MAGGTIEYLRPDDEYFWETCCQRIFAHINGLSDVQRFKARGHKQFGIDLLATLDDGSAIAVQCKKLNSEGNLTESIAQQHIDMTAGLGVDLKLLYFATTHEENLLQTWATNKSSQHADNREANKLLAPGAPRAPAFAVAVYAWHDIENLFRQHRKLHDWYLEAIGCPRYPPLRPVSPRVDDLGGPRTPTSGKVSTAWSSNVGATPCESPLHKVLPEITVVLADDHPGVRAGLSRLLSEVPSFSIVAEVGSAEEAMHACVRTRARVLVSDIDMPGSSAFEAVRALKASGLDTAVLFFSAFVLDRYVEAALDAGAKGYITKAEPLARLVQAIHRVAAGDTFFSPEVQARLVAQADGSYRLNPERKPTGTKFTERELEVMRHIARGLSKQEIAKAMHLSVKTVDNHTVSIMNRLAIHDRVELARYAIRAGLVES